jgi:hypothetical protein
MTISGVTSRPAGQDGLAAASAEYIRQARRLRHRHRHDPARLQQSLHRLAGGSHISVRPGAAGGAPAVLTAEVEQAMEGPILRYDERARLLRRARQLGIERFEANLLIATIQHRRRQAGCCAPDRPGVRQGRVWSVWGILGLALAVEAAAILVGWWAILGG